MSFEKFPSQEKPEEEVKPEREVEASDKKEDEEKFNKVLTLEDFHPISVKAECDEEGNIKEVLENIDSDIFAGYGEDAIQKAIRPLLDAGVSVEYEPWTTEGGEDREGELHIKKEDINKAIKEGKLKLKAE